MAKKILALIIFVFAQTTHAGPKSAYVWNDLRDGLRYTSFSFSGEDFDRTILHAFEVDPKKFRIEPLLASSPQGEFLETIAKREGAVVAVNGGFFRPDHSSIGLIIKDKKIINKQHHTSWWSIFSLEDNVPQITNPSEFYPSPATQMAIQAGPRLVVNGLIPKLKDGKAERTGIGITSTGKIILLITEGMPLSMRQFAERFVLSRWQGGLECMNAMNLDGGGSTQLYAAVGKLSISLPGRSKVANAIGVFPK
ncbi:MAG: phosphodiester glycosidase family protein [Deltaproteobacteria bacterium]|nr:phosphodiester glycosidase family protein [Deltaproteobacteria bacterium]